MIEVLSDTGCCCCVAKHMAATHGGILGQIRWDAAFPLMCVLHHQVEFRSDFAAEGRSYLQPSQACPVQYLVFRQNQESFLSPS